MQTVSVDLIALAGDHVAASNPRRKVYLWEEGIVYAVTVEIDSIGQSIVKYSVRLKERSAKGNIRIIDVKDTHIRRNKKQPKKKGGIVFRHNR